MGIASASKHFSDQQEVRQCFTIYGIQRSYLVTLKETEGAAQMGDRFEARPSGFDRARACCNIATYSGFAECLVFAPHRNRACNTGMFGRVTRGIDDDQQDVTSHRDSVSRFTRFIEH